MSSHSGAVCNRTRASSCEYRRLTLLRHFVADRQRRRQPKCIYCRFSATMRTRRLCPAFQSDLAVVSSNRRMRNCCVLNTVNKRAGSIETGVRLGVRSSCERLSTTMMPPGLSAVPRRSIAMPATAGAGPSSFTALANYLPAAGPWLVLCKPTTDDIASPLGPGS